MDQPFLTAKDVCKRLRCATSTLYRWLDLGLFPRPMHMGSMVRWKESDLEEFIKRADLKRKERGPRPAGIRRGRPSGSRNRLLPQRSSLVLHGGKFSFAKPESPPGVSNRSKI
jgi:excisionase family DNA binding protein